MSSNKVAGTNVPASPGPRCLPSNIFGLRAAIGELVSATKDL